MNYRKIYHFFQVGSFLSEKSFYSSETSRTVVLPFEHEKHRTFFELRFLLIWTCGSGERTLVARVLILTRRK